MNRLLETAVYCPCCGEQITILIDGSIEEQQYTEDCQVCCRPLDIHVIVQANGSFQVKVRAEND